MLTPAISMLPMTLWFIYLTVAARVPALRALAVRSARRR